MPQGLQVFDASGNIVFDTSDRVGRVLGTVRIPATASGVGGSGSVTIPTDAVNGTPFYCFYKDYLWASGTTARYQDVCPVFTISGFTISWVTAASYTTNLGNYAPLTGAGGWLIYGVY